MKPAKIFSFGILIFLIINFLNIISAQGVLQTDKFFDDSTNVPVTGVDELLFRCSDSTCSSQGTLVFNTNTGNSNSLTFEYSFNPNSNPNNQDFFSHFSFSALSFDIMDILECHSCFLCASSLEIALTRDSVFARSASNFSMDSMASLR